MATVPCQTPGTPHVHIHAPLYARTQACMQGMRTQPGEVLQKVSKGHLSVLQTSTRGQCEIVVSRMLAGDHQSHLLTNRLKDGHLLRFHLNLYDQLSIDRSIPNDGEM